MQHSSLVSFLDGTTPANAFWLEIEAEVNACLEATSERGGVGHVVISDGPETIIERRHLNVLVSQLADGSLPIQAAAYIADALIFSDSFDFGDDDEVSDIVGFLSDESEPLSREEVQALHTRLSIGTD